MSDMGSTAVFKRCLHHVRYHPDSGAIGHFARACNVAAIGVGYWDGCAFVWGTMKNDSLWRGTLVVAFAIGAGWIGYMGWPLNGLITRAAEQSNSPNRSQAPAVFQDPNCLGNDKHALMCRLVNEYRATHGLKPVQLDGLVTREAQYWSDQLNRQNACWLLYHDSNYHARMRARFPGRRFRENAACSRSTGGGAKLILHI
jgi:hypothetical protein